MTLRIAFIRQHASPVAAPGGIDCSEESLCGSAGAALAESGRRVNIFTRCDDNRRAMSYKIPRRWEPPGRCDGLLVPTVLCPFQQAECPLDAVRRLREVLERPCLSRP